MNCGNIADAVVLLHARAHTHTHTHTHFTFIHFMDSEVSQKDRMCFKALKCELTEL